MKVVNAETWRGMTSAEIIASLDIAVRVLEEKQKRRPIDKDWLKLLHDIGIRCIQIVDEQL